MLPSSHAVTRDPRSRSRAWRGEALARAALLGNPSDGFGGKTLGFAIAGMGARVTLGADEPEAEAAGAGALIAAAIARFNRITASRCPRRGSVRTEIPREVGLGGSSAIVIATLRALCERSRHPARAGGAGRGWRWRSRPRTSGSPPGRRTASSRPTRASCSWTSPAGERLRAARPGAAAAALLSPTRATPPRRRRPSTATCAAASADGDGRTRSLLARDRRARRARARRAARRPGATSSAG